MVSGRRGGGLGMSP